MSNPQGGGPSSDDGTAERIRQQVQAGVPVPRIAADLGISTARAQQFAEDRAGLGAAYDYGRLLAAFYALAVAADREGDGEWEMNGARLQHATTTTTALASLRVHAKRWLVLAHQRQDRPAGDEAAAAITDYDVGVFDLPEDLSHPDLQAQVWNGIHHAQAEQARRAARPEH